MRLPDRREVLCATHALLEAPETPLGLRRNMVVRDASLVIAEPTAQQIAELGFDVAWRSKGDGIDLQNRDLRFADLSGSDLRRADLRGANLERAVLRGAKLVASRAGDIERAEVGACMYRRDGDSNRCLTGLVEADLSAADLRLLEGWKSDLQGADLSGASLEDAVLDHARLDAALLVWARLDRAQLNGASLAGAVLREASAAEVWMIQADLTYAFLRKADLAKANLTDIDLERADLGRIRVDGAIYRGDRPYSTVLRQSEGPGRAEPPLDRYGPPAAAPADLELELTVGLFQRACRRDQEEAGASEVEALQARGVVRRLWHEFDYSMSHDRPGYAQVADLRYLLARLMLSESACPRAAAIEDRHRVELRHFLAEWCAWRRPPSQGESKAIEPALEKTWLELRPLVLGTAQVTAADPKVVPDIWQRLDQELAPLGACAGEPDADQAAADKVCPQTGGCAS